VTCIKDPDGGLEDHVEIRAGGSDLDGYAEIRVGKDYSLGNIYEGNLGTISFGWKPAGESAKSLTIDQIDDVISLLSKQGGALEILQVDADQLTLPSLVVLPSEGSKIKNATDGGNLRVLNSSAYEGQINDYTMVIANTLDDPANEESSDDKAIRVLKLGMSEDPLDSFGGQEPIAEGSLLAFFESGDNYPYQYVSDDRFLLCASNTNTSGGGGTARFFIDGLGVLSSSLTVQHWVIYLATSESNRLEKMKPGMILSSTGKLFNKTRIDQALPIVSLATTSNDKTVYGVLSDNIATGFDLDKWNTFEGTYNSKCKRRTMDDDMVDPCSYSDDSMYYKARTNSGGEGLIWITNINGELQNGDYVTTSEIPGYGKLQDDDLLHSYTVAKVVEEIDWDSITETIEHNGVNYKAALVGCTYHCG